MLFRLNKETVFRVCSDSVESKNLICKKNSILLLIDRELKSVDWNNEKVLKNKFYVNGNIVEFYEDYLFEEYMEKINEL